MSREQQLGEFLRSRRLRLDPEHFGIGTVTRRRTTGLRREEVAILAGIGVSWYTSLEQGRNVHPSPQALRSLAKALRLNSDETTYVFELAGHWPPIPSESHLGTVSTSLQRALDGMRETPAYVVNRRWDRLAWNRAAVALFGDFGAEPKSQLNLVRKTFTNPKVRHYVLDWENTAQVILAEFQASCARYPDDPAIAELVEELSSASPEFKAWWPRRDILARREKRTRIIHPLVGVMSLEHSSYYVSYDQNLTLCLYTALREDDSQEKLRLITRDITQPTPPKKEPAATGDDPWAQRA